MAIEFEFDDNIPEEDREKLRNHPRILDAVAKLEEMVTSARAVKGEKFVLLVQGMANGYQAMRLMKVLGEELVNVLTFEDDSHGKLLLHYLAVSEFIVKMMADAVKRAGHMADMSEAEYAEAHKFAKRIIENSDINLTGGDKKEN